MRDLLFLCHRFPYPPDKGEKITTWHILEKLAQSWRIHLGCFLDDPDDAQHEAYLRSVCADLLCVRLNRRRQRLVSLLRARPGRPLTLGFFENTELRAWVAGKLADPAIRHAFVYCSAMAPYLMQAQNSLGGMRRVLDMADIDSEKWAEYAATAAWPARLVWRREARTLLAFEKHAAAQYDRTLFISPAEAARFRELAPDLAGRIGYLENGVDLEKFSPSHRFTAPFPPGGPVLAFTGTMNYWPNVDAVCWFAGAVMPLLRQTHPDARFFIVGTSPAPAVQRLALLPGLHVTGRVPDVRPYLAHADVVVAPLRIARGVQNKVLEALAMGRPVVASPQAFEGIRATPGRDLLLAEGAAKTVAHISAVLAGAHPGLGAAGRRAMEAGYAWNATLAGLEAIMAGTADANTIGEQAAGEQAAEEQVMVR